MTTVRKAFIIKRFSLMSIPIDTSEGCACLIRVYNQTRITHTHSIHIIQRQVNR